jgi:multidrug efflux pump subunit AcrA (membrane-fusion protein)
MSERSGRSWLNWILAGLCVCAIAAGALVVGPASGSQSTQTRTATAVRGVVQATASGSGNLQAGEQREVDFKTSGTLVGVYVHAGEHVLAGQLLGAIDPSGAQVALEQARASLDSAPRPPAGLPTHRQAAGRANRTRAAVRARAPPCAKRASPSRVPLCTATS